jgi:translation elongation factor EF-Tu-like GTPase
MKSADGTHLRSWRARGGRQLRVRLSFADPLGGQGYRTGLASADYRPTIALGERTAEGREIHYGVAIIAEPSNDTVHSGEAIDVVMSGLMADLPNAIQPGTRFEVREGPTIVAEGRVIARYS